MAKGASPRARSKSATKQAAPKNQSRRGLSKPNARMRVDGSLSELAQQEELQSAVEKELERDGRHNTQSDPTTSCPKANPTHQRRLAVQYSHGHGVGSTTTAQADTMRSRKSSFAPSAEKKRKVSMSAQDSLSKKVHFDSTASETRRIQGDHVPSKPERAYQPNVEDDNTFFCGGSGQPSSDNTYIFPALPTSSEELEGHPTLPQNPTSYLLVSLHECPQQLSLPQIGDLFMLLQKLTQSFAETHFGRDPDDTESSIEQDMVEFPLHDLELKHPQLYLIIKNLLDATTTNSASQPGWLKFLAHPDYRPHLVFAILGEWFKERIFKDNTFGLDSELTAIINEMDQEQIYNDAFARTRYRGQLIQTESEGNHSLPRGSRDVMDLIWPVHELTDELLSVLAPLMPRDPSWDQDMMRVHTNGTIPNLSLVDELFTLIGHCAALNVSIVRTGVDGTIIRLADRFRVGQEYRPGAPVTCINQQQCNDRLEHFDKKFDLRLIVKMTCWSRVEAYVPRGPGLFELHDVQGRRTRDIAKSIGKLEDDECPSNPDDFRAAYPELWEQADEQFCWICEDLETEMWPVLPEDCRKYYKEHREKKHIKVKSFDKMEKFSRKREFRRKRKAVDKREAFRLDDAAESDDIDSDAWRPDSPSGSGFCSEYATPTQSPHGSAFGIAGHQPKPKTRANEPIRNSYVTYFPRVTPHAVYCEYTLPTAQYDAELALDRGVEGQKISEYNSLDATIARARAELSCIPRLQARNEDVMKQLWDFYATHNLKIEWSTFVVFAIFAVSRGGALNAVARGAIATANATHNVLFREFEALNGTSIPAAVLDVVSANVSLLKHGVDQLIIVTLRATGRGKEILFTSLKQLVEDTKKAGILLVPNLLYPTGASESATLSSNFSSKPLLPPPASAAGPILTSKPIAPSIVDSFASMRDLLSAVVTAAVSAEHSAIEGVRDIISSAVQHVFGHETPTAEVPLNAKPEPSNPINSVSPKSGVSTSTITHGLDESTELPTYPAPTVTPDTWLERPAKKLREWVGRSGQDGGPRTVQENLEDEETPEVTAGRKPKRRRIDSAKKE